MNPLLSFSAVSKAYDDIPVLNKINIDSTIILPETSKRVASGYCRGLHCMNARVKGSFLGLASIPAKETV